jgi:hypothetical protein
MRANWIKTGVWLCTLSLVSLAAAEGSLPPDQFVRYRIHQNPGDANSAVVFDIIMGLSAIGRDGENIGWDIESLEFRQPVGGGEPTVWVDAAPPMNTSDGLWWVQHQNADAPEISEFLEPPLLIGSAVPVDPANGNLEYSLQGSDLQLPGPFEHTAALTYSFSAIEPGVIKSATDEPAELDPLTDVPPA